MIVIDASAIVDVILARPAAVMLVDRVFSNSQEIITAPDFIDAEVVASLRRAWLRKIVDDAQVAESLVMFDFLPIQRHASRGLVRRMWELRHNVKTYDASYVALSELLNVPLITRDKHLANSSGHAARIEYIA